MAKKALDVPVFAGCVDDEGRLRFEDDTGFRAYVESLGAGALVDVTVVPQPLSATDAQRRWWFGVAIANIAEELGYDRHEREALHYALLREFGGTTTRDGVELAKFTSWRDLSVREAWELMEWVCRFAAETWGQVLVLPSELRDRILAELAETSPYISQTRT